jgi:ATP-dependent 26S proteasome regulatory subunit
VTIPSQTWSDNNQKYLVKCINQIRISLKKYIEHPTSSEEAAIVVQEEEQLKQEEDGDDLLKRTEKSPPPALETVCSLFGLTTFEKSILMLCAGVELDTELAQLCAKAQGNPNNTYPTFGLALAFLARAHWSALTPASPLRRFRLIELYGAPPVPITTSPLHIEERVLHYLTGLSYFETQLQGMVKPVRENGPIVESHNHLLDSILLACQKNMNGKLLPIIQLWGIDETSKVIIAKRACAKMGVDLWYLPAELVPSKADDMNFFIQLWSREAALLGSGLYISAEDDLESTMQRSIKRLVYDIPGPIFLGTRERWSLNNSDCMNISLEVKKPKKSEQRDLWKLYLGKESSHQLSGKVPRIVSQFDLNASGIQTAAREALVLAKNNGGDNDNTDVSNNNNNNNNNDNLFDALWKACREVTRPKISELTQQISSKARMDDLVLPEREKKLLHEIAIHIEQRDKVYEDWGFKEATDRGLGVTALFSGNSGTGKTMAAEALAGELCLDLFRIDLSTVMSKYIGETEKNLRKVFDAAEDGGAILFFDEADALFGKRSEVKDSHDRYANIEIAYLLQRMESYRGLAILATNMKNTIDQAFMRRITFTVNFPFPNEKSRAEIWRRIFPPSTPTNNLDIDRLARLNITGGNIRNIAINASFLAADEGVPVNMNHVKFAAQAEYIKLERPLAQTELGDWH